MYSVCVVCSVCAHASEVPIYITSEAIHRRWGDVETVSIKPMKCRLQWLGHVARMFDSRIPKIIQFGWLPQPRPSFGPKRRWRDVKTCSKLTSA